MGYGIFIEKLNTKETTEILTCNVEILPFLFANIDGDV